MENSSQLFNNVVLQLSKLESYQVLCLLLVLLVTTSVTGCLERLRLVLFCLVFNYVYHLKNCFMSLIIFLFLDFRELGYPWECTLTVPTMYQLVLFTHSQSPAGMESGQLFKV